jgi:hypothetical protein
MRFTLFIVPNDRNTDADWVVYLSLALSCCAVGLGVWGLSRTGLWDLPSTGAFKDFTAGVGSIVTAGAVLVGGTWTYFKFIRGRTYRPRLSVDVAGQWRVINGADVLHVRVRVTNIGASKVSLNQYGSGVRVSFPTAGQRADEIEWEPILAPARGDNDAANTEKPKPRVFEVLGEHEWIEPGETVSDELLLNLLRPPSIYMLEVRLSWGMSEQHNEYSNKDVVVFARRILPPHATLVDTISSSTEARSDPGAAK